MGITIEDVAKHAKVSVGTVSRVLHGEESVGAEKRRRVEAAIRELDYTPRQSKITKRQHFPLAGKNVLLLLLGMDRSLAALPAIARALHGVETAVAAAHANLLFADAPTLSELPEPLANRNADAIVIKAALQGDLWTQTSRPLRDAITSKPYVWCLGRPHGFHGDAVGVCDWRVGQIAAECLLKNGHRRLGFISPKPSQTALMRRQASFQFFAERGGAEVLQLTGEASDWTFPLSAVENIESVDGLVDGVLTAEDPPTAIFAPDDSIGALTHRALTKRGIRIGSEVSVISCNNDGPLLAGLFPELTTVDIHPEAIGRRTVDQLLWRIGRPDEPSQEVTVEPTLVIGQSIAMLEPPVRAAR